MSTEPNHTPPPRRIWGVYHADGGLVGELAYVVGKVRGTARCALCDVTHRIRMKPQWKAFVANLDVPFRLVHLNEQPEPLALKTRGRTPCVVAQTRAGFEILIGPEALDAAEGSVERFAELLQDARASRSLGGRGV